MPHAVVRCWICGLLGLGFEFGWVGLVFGWFWLSAVVSVLGGGWFGGFGLGWF